MKRREFSLSAAAVLATGTLSKPALAQARQFREGRDFRRLGTPVTPDAPAGKVEVIEFFWYSCPHCHAFEATLSAWAKTAPKDMHLRRMPVAFNSSFVPQQKLFYALEGMGKLGEMHTKVFRAIHEEKQKLDKDQDILAWADKQGLNAAKFKELYNSFNVSNQARRATQLQDIYGVEGVPAMGVAGKFYTDGQMTGGGLQTVLQVVDYLVAMSRTPSSPAPDKP